MPLYDYECRSCHHRFELRHGFNETPETRCPLCEQPACRVFHPAPIIFKGSGFYVNDYRKPDNSRKEPAAIPAPKAKEEPAKPAKKD